MSKKQEHKKKIDSKNAVSQQRFRCQKKVTNCSRAHSLIAKTYSAFQTAIVKGAQDSILITENYERHMVVKHTQYEQFSRGASKEVPVGHNIVISPLFTNI